MKKMKLFMALMGCKPKARLTEQHDVFFAAGYSLKELLPQMKACWPEGKSNLHLDAWREVNNVEGYSVKIANKNTSVKSNISKEETTAKLFFLNLGGYKKDEFEEFHYKMLIVASTASEAIRKCKKTFFYKHIGFKEAPSHVDDKYGLDVDDVYPVKDLLSADFKNSYELILAKTDKRLQEDIIHLGYFKFDKIEA